MLRSSLGRPVSLGVKPPSGTQEQICITVTRLRIYWSEAPTLTRGLVCSLQLLLALASTVILGSESLETHDHCTVSDSRYHLEGQIPLFISPKVRSGPIIPPCTVFLFVASYDSQDHGGRIRTHLHEEDEIQQLTGPAYNISARTA
jgi:hypothetical protein